MPRNEQHLSEPAGSCLLCIQGSEIARCQAEPERGGSCEVTFPNCSDRHRAPCFNGWETPVLQLSAAASGILPSTGRAPTALHTFSKCRMDPGISEPLVPLRATRMPQITLKLQPPPAPSFLRRFPTYLCWLLVLRRRHQHRPLAHQACVNHLSLRTKKRDRASLVPSLTPAVTRAPAPRSSPTGKRLCRSRTPGTPGRRG